MFAEPKLFATFPTQRSLLNRLSQVLCLASLLLSGAVARGQLKAIPTQAECDPILENLESKLKDFAGTLHEFKAEATAMDEARLSADMQYIQRLQEMILATHGGVKGDSNAVNIQQLVRLLVGANDIALEASAWQILAAMKMSQLMALHQAEFQRYSAFGMRAHMDLRMLREVSGQLSHPVLRLAAAADELISAQSESSSSRKR